MKNIIAKKLKKGDEIRVIAPSRSLKIIEYHTIEYAVKTLKDLGYKVTFSKNVNNCDDFNSSSIEKRIDDLHLAFLDSNVKCILTAIGGYNANQLLPYLDFEIIINNPKIFCGFSDIIILSNAIYSKTGLVTYYGPHFSSFGMLEGAEYQNEYFNKVLTNSQDLEIQHARYWSNDEWYLKDNKRNFKINNGYQPLAEGFAKGIVVGGHLGTLNLLNGTLYKTDLKNKIVLIEDDGSSIDEFCRNLECLFQQKDSQKIIGLIIGRFLDDSIFSLNKIKLIIESMNIKKGIQIICDFNVGHTQPISTIPIGGQATLSVAGSSIEFKLLKNSY